MRLRDLGDLPPTLTTAQLAELTGIGERTWWEVARGEAEASIDIEAIRIGSRVLRWPTAKVLRALGLDVSAEASGDDHAPTLRAVPTGPESDAQSKGQNAQRPGDTTPRGTNHTTDQADRIVADGTGT